ncbi:hypothetical protein CsatA_005455 [Cannabis sativa]
MWDGGEGPNDTGAKWFHTMTLPPILGSKSKKRKAAGSVSPIVNLALNPSHDFSTSKGQELSFRKGGIVPFSLGKDSPKKGSSSSRKLRSKKTSLGSSNIVEPKITDDDGSNESGSSTDKSIKVIKSGIYEMPQSELLQS